MTVRQKNFLAFTFGFLWICLFLGRIAAGQETPIKKATLTVNQAGEIISLVDQLGNLKVAKVDPFKLSVRIDLARRILDELKKTGAVRLEQVRDAPLWSGDATVILTEDEREKVDKARTKLKAGETTIEMQEAWVELSWTFSRLRWHLRCALHKMLEEKSNLILEASAQDRYDLVEKALQNWMKQERDAAMLRLYVAQPEWLAQLLEVDRAKIEGWLTQLDPPAPQLPQGATADQIRAAWSEFRKRALQVDETKFAENISNEVARLNEKLNILSHDATNARKLLKANAKRLFVDLPAEHGDQKPFLRMRLQWPNGEEQASMVSASAYMVWPHRTVEVQVSPKRQGGDVAFQPPSTMPSSAPTTEEVPLGVSFRKLHIDQDGRLSLPPSVEPLVNIDTPQLQAALHRFGMPEPVKIHNARFIEPSLKVFTLELEVELPSLDQRLWLKLRIDPMELVADGGMERMLRQIKLSKGLSVVEYLQQQLIEQLKTRLAKTHILDVGQAIGLRLSDLSANGDWSEGTLQITAMMQLGKEGPRWPVTIQIVRDGSRWRLNPAPHLIPGEVVDWLRVRTQTALASAIGIDANRFDILARTVSVDDVKYVPTEHRIVGTLTVPVSTPPVIQVLSLPFTADLEGDVSIATGDALELLKSSLKDTLEMLIANAQDSATAALVDHLNGSSLSLPGLSAKVQDAFYEPAQKRYRVKLLANISGTQFDVGPVYLLDFKLDNGAVINPRMDFSDATINPDPGVLLAKALGEDTLPIHVSQVRGSTDGVRFSAELRIEELGQPLPLGEFHMGIGGTAWNREALTKAVQKQVAELLKGNRLELPDVGPVSDLAVDPAKGDIAFTPFTLRLRGTVNLGGTINLPVIVHIKPHTKVEVEDTALQAVKGPIEMLLHSEVLPKDLSDFRIENLKQIEPWARPYGVAFDVSVNLLGMTFKVTQLKVTQAGVRVPDMVRVQLAGMYPIGPLVLLDPGIGLPMRNDVKRIDILGDITIGSDGVEKLIKVAAEMQLKLAEMQVDLNGRTILLENLPVFQTKGVASFKSGRMELENSTLGLIDRVVSVHGKAILDAPSREFTQDASIGIFGVKIANTRMRLIAQKDLLFEVAGRADLVLVKGDAWVKGVLPETSRFKVDSDIKANVAGFELGSAHVGVEISKAELGCKVAGIKLTLIVPGISELTQGTVAEAIQSLFDFDFDLSALMRRDIVIDLRKPDGSPADGGSVGQSDPGQPKQDISSGLTVESLLNQSTVASTSKEEKSTNIPSEVYMYQGGDSILRFKEYSKAPPLFVAEYFRNNVLVGQEHYPVSPEMMNRIKRIIVIGREEIRRHAGQNEPKLCRSENKHPIIELMIGLDRDEAKVYLLYLSRDQMEALDMSDSPVQLIKPGSLSEFWSFISDGSKGKKALRPGDIRLLNEWAKSKAIGTFSSFDFKSRNPVNLTDLSATSGLKLPDVRAYRYKLMDDQDNIVWRVAVSDPDVYYEAKASEPLSAVITSDLTSDHHKRLLAYILFAKLANENVEIIESRPDLNEVIFLFGHERLVLFSPDTATTVTLRSSYNDFRSMLRESETKELWQKLKETLKDFGNGSTLWIAKIDDTWRGLAGWGIEEGTGDWKLRLWELRNGQLGPTQPRMTAKAISERYRALINEDLIFDPNKPQDFDTSTNRQWLIDRLLEPLAQTQQRMSVSPTLVLKDQ